MVELMRCCDMFAGDCCDCLRHLGRAAGLPPVTPPLGGPTATVVCVAVPLSRVVASHARAQVCFPHACAACLRWF